MKVLRESNSARGFSTRWCEHFSQGLKPAFTPPLSAQLKSLRKNAEIKRLETVKGRGFSRAVHHFQGLTVRLGSRAPSKLSTPIVFPQALNPKTLKHSSDLAF